MNELRACVPDDQRTIGESVVLMNFTAAADQQWQFILAAVEHAQADEELAHIAAGPMEHLLGKHGVTYIDEIEHRAATDPKFARMLKGVARYRMSEEVWARVQALKQRSPNRPAQP